MDVTFADYHARTRSSPEGAATYLYRYFRLDGRLLYVGITSDPVRRNEGHMDAIWWPYAGLVRYEAFPTRELAEAAESFAIENECPDHNAQLRPCDDAPSFGWFWDRAGGQFQGECPAWFALSKRGAVALAQDAPEWWARPYQQIGEPGNLNYHVIMGELPLAPERLC